MVQGQLAPNSTKFPSTKIPSFSHKNINQNDVDIGENYIARVNWQDNHNVVLVYMVRNQDQTTSVFAQSNENNSWTQAAANQFTSPYGWVGSFGPWWPMSSNDVNSFFTIRTKAEVAAESIRNLKAGRDGVTADEIPEGFWTVGRVDRDSFTYLSDHAARYSGVGKRLGFWADFEDCGPKITGLS